MPSDRKRKLSDLPLPKIIMNAIKTTPLVKLCADAMHKVKGDDIELDRQWESIEDMHYDGLITYEQLETLRLLKNTLSFNTTEL